MAAQCGGFAQNDQLHAGAGHGDVHAAQVGEETYLTPFVGTDQTDEDDVAFLPLKTIYGVDAHQVAVGAQDGTAGQIPTSCSGGVKVFSQQVVRRP